MELAETDYGSALAKTYPGYKPGLFSKNAKDPAFSKTGLYGDPMLATAEKGKKALQIMTRQWLKTLREFTKEPLRQ
jgi:creatinine amidohydrolase/Fe(II)-dependent formamide hydrolase-like protein